MADETLPSLAETAVKGESLYSGVPQFAPPPPSAEPPPIPASISGAPTISDFVAGMSPQQRGIYDLMMQAQRAQAAQYQASANAAAGAKLRENAAMREYLAEPRPDIYQPKYKPLPTAAKAEYRSPLQAIGNPLAGLALVAGFFTRQAGTTALKSAAAAMKAQREGDEIGYKNAHEAFRDSLDEVMRSNDQERTAYLDSWNNRKMTMDEKMADLQMKASIYRNEAMAAAARSGNVSQAQMQLNALLKAKEVMDNLAPVAKTTDQFIIQEYQKLQANIRQQHPDWDQQKVLAETNKIAESTGLFRLKKTTKTDEEVYSELKQKFISEGMSEAEASAKALEEVSRAKSAGQRSVQEMRDAAAMDRTIKRGVDAATRQDDAIKARVTAATERDKQIKPDERKHIDGLANAYANYQRAIDTWDDSYAGLPIKKLDEFLLAFNRKFPGGDADKAALWWQAYNRFVTLPERNKTFGATLTAHEKASWDAADISVADSPQQIKALLGLLRQSTLDNASRYLKLMQREGRDVQPIVEALGFPPEVLGGAPSVQAPAGATYIGNGPDGRPQYKLPDGQIVSPKR